MYDPNDIIGTVWRKGPPQPGVSTLPVYQVGSVVFIDTGIPDQEDSYSSLEDMKDSLDKDWEYVPVWEPPHASDCNIWVGEPCDCQASKREI